MQVWQLHFLTPLALSFSLTSCFSRCSEVSTSPPSPGQSQFSHDKQTTQHNNPHMLLLLTKLPTTHPRQRSASFLPRSLHRTSSTSWVSSPVRGVGKIKPGNIHTCTVFQLLLGASTGSLSQRYFQLFYAGLWPSLQHQKWSPYEVHVRGAFSTKKKNRPLPTKTFLQLAKTAAMFTVPHTCTCM